MSEDELTNIKNLLEDIKGLLLLANQDKIEEIKRNTIRSGSVEETVYNLCQDESTNENLASQIKKDVPYVRAVISSLRQKGLIKTITKNGKKVHERRY